MKGSWFTDNLAREGYAVFALGADVHHQAPPCSNALSTPQATRKLVPQAKICP